MHFQRIHLRAFGHFTDQTIDFESPSRPFHLVYGRNESGKSTTMRAINALLFGFPSRTNDDFLHRSGALRVGGTLADGDQTLEIVRRKGTKRTLLTSDESDEVSQDTLNDWLGGVTESEFKSRFGLSHQELVVGGQSILAGQGDLGQILFAAGAGLGQLREILAAIEQDAKSLYSPRGSKPAINQAISQIDDHRGQLRAAQVPPSRFVQLQRDIAAQQTTVDELEKQIVKESQQIERWEAMAKALPILPAWRDANEAVAGSSKVVDLDEAFTDRRRSTAEDLNFARNRRRELQQQIAEIELKLQSMPADTSVLMHEAEIQSLFQDISAHDTAEMNARDLNRPLGSVIRKMVASLRELSIEIDSGDDESMLEQIGDAVDRIRISESNARRIIELAGTRGGLDQDLSSVEQELGQLESLRSSLADKRAAQPAPPNTAVLAKVLQTLGDPQELVDHLSDQVAQRDRLSARCETILRKLDGFSGTADEAVRLELPSATAIDRGDRAIRQSYETLRAAQSARAELLTQREQMIADKAKVEDQVDLPSESQLLDARKRRDDSIDAVSPETLASDLVGVRQRVVSADQLVDTMRQHHERVNQVRLLDSQIERISIRVSQSESQVEAANTDFEDAKRAWNQMWTDCGVAASKPDRMRSWMGEHQSLCECVGNGNHQQKQVDAAAEKIDRTWKRIIAAIPEGLDWETGTVGNRDSGDGDRDDDPALRLIRTVDRVTAALNENQKRLDQYHAEVEEIQRIEDQLPATEERVATSKAAIAAWRNQWQSLTSVFDAGSTETDDSAGKGDSADSPCELDPAEMVERLTRITDLVNQRREADIVVKRKRSIARNSEVYASRVQRLATNLGEPAGLGATADRNQPEDAGPKDAEDTGDSGNPDSADDAMPSLDLAAATATVQRWFARLQNERSATQTRGSLTGQLDALRARQAEAESQCQHFESILDELCKEAGCPTPEELPDRERAARSKQADLARHAELRSQLLILCGNESIDDFVDQAADQQPAVLEINLEKQRRVLDELRGQWATANQSLGAMKHESSAIDGSTAAAALSQDMQLVLGKLGTDVARYTRHRVATMLLRRAIEHYRLENQSPILKLAEDTFSDLTLGKYRGLSTDYDSKGNAVLCAVPGDGGPEVPASLLSTGTADALYLTLRLASLEHHLSEGKRIPLVVDDCLVQLDDDRSVAAMRHFSRLSEQTQVIMFTHHEHLIELAREHLDPGEFHVHDLASHSVDSSRLPPSPPLPPSLLPS